METRSQEVLGKILKFIRNRNYEKGERLISERAFAEKFSTTRQSVREALASLETMRVVERRTNSGIFLCDMKVDSSIEVMVLDTSSGNPLEMSEVSEAMEFRRILEVHATRLACQRRDDEDIVTIEKTLQDTAKKLENKESIEMEDEAFHRAIVASTKNSIFVRAVNSFYKMSQFRRNIYFGRQSRCKLSYQHHRKIFEAIVKEDSELAAKLMEDHLTRTSEAWATLLSA